MKKLITKIKDIISSNIYNIIKEILKEILIPFVISEIEAKKDLEIILNIVLFDYKEIERKNELKAIKSNEIPNNNICSSKIGH